MVGRIEAVKRATIRNRGATHGERFFQAAEGGLVVTYREVASYQTPKAPRIVVMRL